MDGSRRDFLRLSLLGSGALLLGVALPAAPLLAQTQPPPPPPDPHLYMRIDPDNRITITTPRSEMGQGVRTSLAMLVAEELEADWRQVQVATLGLDARAGDQGTGGSNSVAGLYEPLRRLGASLRELLIAAAAARWQVPAGECAARDSQVTHARSQRSAHYADLIEAAAKLTPNPSPTLKPRAQWRLLGKPQTGKDCADIIHGRAGYGLDVRRPGQLYAQIERPRRYGARVAGFNAQAALAVPGVRQVFALEPGPGNIAGGVAVVATSTWAAAQGRAKLAVQWNEQDAGGDDSEALAKAALAALDTPPAEAVNKVGDPDAVLAAAAKVIRADYQLPFLAHATLEPQNATAQWSGDQLTVWAPTQFPGLAARSIAKALELKPEQITLHITLLGGGFGRRINGDYAVEAALVARQVAAPVQVMWTREDDLRHDFYRPLVAHRFEACLDADGWPLALRHRQAGTPIGATYDKTGQRKFGPEEIEGAGNGFYRAPNRSSGYTALTARVPRGWWRAVHTTHASFAMECFIDELAAAAGKDALAYRLALIDTIPVPAPGQDSDYAFNPARMRACLQRAAELAGWGKPLPKGQALGLACAIDHRSYAALVLQVSLQERELRIHRATCVADCGLVINPDGARAQIEGGIVQGLSAALGEAVTLKDGAVVEGNFHEYRLLRLAQAPLRVDTQFIESEAVKLTGLGEPALPLAAPALANALHALTGKRLRQLPLRWS